MKQTFLAVCFVLSACFQSNAQIVITEIMYNPPPSGTDTLEYIELYNNTSGTVDVSGWSFSQGVEFTFPAGTTMAAGSYVIICENKAYFDARFPGLTTWEWVGALVNNGEDIILNNAGGTQIDLVDYTNMAPWPTEPNNLGPSLVLCDPNSDNSLPGSWAAATTQTNVVIAGVTIKGNPGAASQCAPPVLKANEDNAVAPSGIAVNLNVLGNDATPLPVTAVTVVTPPTKGSASVNADKTITYTGTAGNCADDQFTYSVCDQSGACSEAVVKLDVRCYAQRTVAQVTGETATGEPDSSGVLCELKGTVYGVNLRPLGNNNVPALLFTIIDNSGAGIAVSSLAGNYGYTVTEKDNITVKGVIGHFNGLTEIRPDQIIKTSGGNPLVSPTSVTQLSEATESQLVKISGLSLVNPSEWTTGVGSGGFNVRAVAAAHPNDTILIRIDRDVETYNAPVPAQPFDLTGLGGQFDANSPYSSGYQILPRYNPDISTLSRTYAADWSERVRVLPNPASVRVQVQSEVSFDRIRLLSPEGRVLRSIDGPGLTTFVDVQGLPEGVYYLYLEKAGAFAVEKVTVAGK